MARNKYSLLTYLDGAGASRAVKSSEEKDGVEVFSMQSLKLYHRPRRPGNEVKTI